MSGATQDQSIAPNEREKVGMLLPPPAIVLGAVAHLLLLGPFTCSSRCGFEGGRRELLARTESPALTISIKHLTHGQQCGLYLQGTLNIGIFL